jgi:DNA (cytosine-5)-methyltransferase 1
LTLEQLSRRKFIARLKHPRAISLFSGCGGSDLALHELGFYITWANDIWDLACRTYRDNIPDAAIDCGDIRDFARFPSANLLVGCYPCQGFTQGGRRKSTDAINYLYREFDRVLRDVLPEAFVVENVSGMAYGLNRELLENQLRRFRIAGYRVKWAALDAQYYGVAQRRLRLFIVGVRSDLLFKYRFPEPTHGPTTTRCQVTQRDVFAGLPPWPSGEFNEERFHWYYLSRNRRGDWDEPSPCIVGHWRHVPLHPSSPALQRLGTDKWAFSSTAPARRLGFRECAALQGFPPSFEWKHGSVRNKFQLIGNAVPPPLFKQVTAGLRELWGNDA